MLVLALAGLTSAAEVAHNPADLIQDAARHGEHRVVIPPGVYRISGGIALSNAHDLEIVGDGVTLIFTRLSRAFDFYRCTNVTFRGFTIDYDPLPFTQGKVSAVSPDQNSVDVRLDDGYPRVLYSRIDVCDPKTRTRKRGMPFLWGTKAAWAEGADDGVVRLTKTHLGAIAAIGDPISMSGGPVPGGQPHAIALEHCGGMVFRDVTLHTAPGMGILEADGDGTIPTRYINVRIIPGPPPAGATDSRLLTTTWDALQCKTSRVGPTLEDCEIRDAGDDSWSVQSDDFVVLLASGREAIVGYRDEYCDGPQTGERLRAASGAQATITDRKAVDPAKAGLPEGLLAKLKSATPWSYWNVGRRMLRVTLDRPVPFAAGESVCDPDRRCNGFVVRRCKFHSPGRGALIKGSDGLIEDNEFVDCHSAVTINAEVPDLACAEIDHIIIRNNRIAGTGYFCPMWESNQAGAISVVGKPTPIRNITIQNNLFDDINGVSICLIGVRDSTIAANRFTRLHVVEPQTTGGQIGVDQHCVLFAADCSDLTISNNSADHPGPFTKTLVSGDYFNAHLNAAQGITIAERS